MIAILSAMELYFVFNRVCIISTVDTVDSSWVMVRYIKDFKFLLESSLKNEKSMISIMTSFNCPRGVKIT
jgi:hypothetical protein